VFLVSHHDLVHVATGIIKVCEHLHPVELGNVGNACVEVDEVRMVAIDDLNDLVAPDLAEAG
jgi:hypothetical protein